MFRCNFLIHEILDINWSVFTISLFIQVFPQQHWRIQKFCKLSKYLIFELEMYLKLILIFCYIFVCNGADELDNPRYHTNKMGLKSEFNFHTRHKRAGTKKNLKKLKMIE